MPGPRELLRRLGYDVVRYPAGLRWGAALADVIRETNADVLVDVGAHLGAFSDLCRTLGFTGPIVSFEPAPEQVAALRRRAADDPSWSVWPIALGAEEGEAELRVAETSVLTSLLAPSQRGLRQYEGMRTASMVGVHVRRLDAVLDDVAPGAERILLKIDTQGSDFQVLLGAQGVLSRVVAMHVELDFQPFYAGASDYLDVLGWLRDRHFEPVEIISGAMSDGLLAEADVLLRRQ